MKPVRIKVQDFQSIDELELDIEGFTCVTGPSNIGKSAILRAVSSAILNKAVVGAVRKGKKFCRVEIGDLVWEKGERVGRYWVPGEGQPRDGIGQGQTEVTEMLGFKSVKVGDRYINPWFASQFNPVFLMEDSGPAVTDFISDIAHLKSLQGAIVHCTRARQRLLTAIKDREEEVSMLQAREEALDGVDNLTKVERDLISQLDSLEEYRVTIALIRRIMADTEDNERTVAALSGHSSVRIPKAAADPAESIMRPARLWIDMEKAAISISSVRGVSKVSVPDALDGSEVARLMRLSSFLRIPSMKSGVAALEGSDAVSVPQARSLDVSGLSRAASLISSIESAAASVKRLGSRLPEVADPPKDEIRACSRMASVLRSIESEQSSLAQLSSEEKKLAAELAEVEAELAAIPSCPTCGQVWDGPKHAHARA